MLGKSKGVFSKKPFNTAVEQATARNIQALSEELLTADRERKKQLQAQIAELKDNLSSSGMKKTPVLQKNSAKEDSTLKPSQSRLEVFDKDENRHLLELRLYGFLLEKYADIIEDFEKKTVGEIKGLVDPQDLSVQSLVIEFREEHYSFEQDFEPAAKKAFSFVQREISFIKPSIKLNFWLSPREILQEKIGDDKDLSVFLCSLLFALGDESAEVVVAEMSDNQTHAFVISESKERFFILDPSQKHDFNAFCGNKTDVLEKYSFQGAKIERFLYRFNRNKYEQFV